MVEHLQGGKEEDNSNFPTSAKPVITRLLLLAVGLVLICIFVFFSGKESAEQELSGKPEASSVGR